tara:strand:+ start:3596 stop:4045 length:450 start_codon:yes stop_codon:yes gene_type:complete
MKKIMILFSILLMVFTACSSTPSAEPEEPIVLTELPALPGAGEAPAEPPAPEPAAAQSETKTFVVSAKRFEFSPSTIEVNEGDTVVIKATSSDVDHGIAISEFGVNVDLPAGEEVEISFVADKKGEYPIICSVFCGSGHKDMTGTLIVN